MRTKNRRLIKWYHMTVRNTHRDSNLRCGKFDRNGTWADWVLPGLLQYKGRARLLNRVGKPPVFEKL